MQESITKVCKKCNARKDVLEFSTHSVRKDGLRGECKVCAAEYQKQYKLEHNDKILQRAKKYRTDNKQKIKEYQNANKEQMKKTNKEWRIANKDRVILKQKEWYALNREEQILSNREYYKNNKDYHLQWTKKYREENKEELRIKAKAYFQTPKGRAANKNSCHKRREWIAEGDVTTQQIAILIANATHCYWCNSTLRGRAVHVDHYVPRVAGGIHTLSNLVITCGHCNLTKSAKDPVEFANSLGRLL